MSHSDLPPSYREIELIFGRDIKIFMAAWIIVITDDRSNSLPEHTAGENDLILRRKLLPDAVSPCHLN